MTDPTLRFCQFIIDSTTLGYFSCNFSQLPECFFKYKDMSEPIMYWLLMLGSPTEHIHSLAHCESMQSNHKIFLSTNYWSYLFTLKAVQLNLYEVKSRHVNWTLVLCPFSSLAVMDLIIASSQNMNPSVSRHMWDRKSVV